MSFGWVIGGWGLRKEAPKRTTLGQLLQDGDRGTRKVDLATSNLTGSLPHSGSIDRRRFECVHKAQACENEGINIENRARSSYIQARKKSEFVGDTTYV